MKLGLLTTDRELQFQPRLCDVMKLWFQKKTEDLLNAGNNRTCVSCYDVV